MLSQHLQSRKLTASRPSRPRGEGGSTHVLSSILNGRPQNGPFRCVSSIGAGPDESL
jgi:hypothetical protein